MWIGAITLFFHRWGKIRMLLPYQPVFKEEEPLGGLPLQASPIAQQQQQRILTNTHKFSSTSHPAAASSSSSAATTRRNQFMVPSITSSSILIHSIYSFIHFKFIEFIRSFVSSRVLHSESSHSFISS